MISVVLPTYNRAPLLPRAINSVLRQSVSDWELIIVDDGSTDDTPQVLARIQDARVSWCRHDKNRGVTAAKNTGLDRIRGAWFTLLDSDDEMTPDALEVMMDCAERTGASAITCNCVDSVTGAMSGIGPTQDGWLTARDAATCRGEHWGLTQTGLLGRLRFDERLPGFETALWLKINSRAHRYYIHRALRVYHTEGTDRVTHAGQQASVTDKARVWCVLGEDSAYLEALRTADPKGYRRTMRRVWVARCLRAVLSRSRNEDSWHE